MGKESGLIGAKADHGGAVDMNDLAERFQAYREATAQFESKDLADAEAKRRGWQTVNTDGKPDHRCPECKSVAGHRSELFIERRGAFIDWGDRKPMEAKT